MEIQLNLCSGTSTTRNRNLGFVQNPRQTKDLQLRPLKPLWVQGLGFKTGPGASAYTDRSFHACAVNDLLHDACRLKEF